MQSYTWMSCDEPGRVKEMLRFSSTSVCMCRRQDVWWNEGGREGGEEAQSQSSRSDHFILVLLLQEAMSCPRWVPSFLLLLSIAGAHETQRWPAIAGE